MLATIRDDTWNVLNMQHMTPNSKRWDYSDTPGGGHKKIKGPAYVAEGGQFYWYKFIHIYNIRAVIATQLDVFVTTEYMHTYQIQKHFWQRILGKCKTKRCQITDLFAKSTNVQIIVLQQTIFFLR